MRAFYLSTVSAFLLAGNAISATYTFTDTSGVDYTIIEADPFASGDTAGNTTAVGGGFFSAGSASATTWRNRAISAFTTGYENVSGATDRVFDNAGPAPEIITPLTGLPAENYQVFAVYIYRFPRDSSTASLAGIKANLHGAISEVGTVTLDSMDVHEYALVTNPTNASDHASPTLDGNRFSFRHLSTRTDIEQIVETSTDLVNWPPIATIRAGSLPNDFAAGVTLESDGNTPEFLSIFPVTTGSSPRTFLRLKVRQLP